MSVWVSDQGQESLCCGELYVWLSWDERNGRHAWGMCNKLTSAFLYDHHIGYLFNWRRDNKDRESCLLLAKDDP
jgi:hypothetical protein